VQHTDVQTLFAKVVCVFLWMCIFVELSDFVCVLRGLWWSVHECFPYTFTQAFSTAPFLFVFFLKLNRHFPVQDRATLRFLVTVQMTEVVFFPTKPRYV